MPSEATDECASQPFQYKQRVLAASMVCRQLPQGNFAQRRRKWWQPSKRNQDCRINVKDDTTWTFDIESALNVTIQNVKMVNDFKWVHGYDLVSTGNDIGGSYLGVTGDDVYDAKASSTTPLSNDIYSNDVAYSWAANGMKVGVQSTGSDNRRLGQRLLQSDQRSKRGHSG